MPIRRRHRVERHLAACHACARELADMRRGMAAAARLRQQLEAMPPDTRDVPAAMARALARARSLALPTPPPRKKRLRRLPTPALAAAVLALALAIPLLLGIPPFRWAAKSALLPLENTAGVPPTAPAWQNETGQKAVTDTSGRLTTPEEREVRTLLQCAGISAEPFFDAREGICTLAIRLRDAQDADRAQALLGDWVAHGAADCTKSGDIEIIFGEAPAIFTDNADGRRYGDALASLAKRVADAQDKEASGPWLILVWQVDH